MIRGKIFLSCDIEGTCGIIDWNETEQGKQDYELFRQQMTREVSAACEGALAGGAEQLLVRDAHDSARNILPSQLPDSDRIRLLRGWCRDPYSMMAGLQEGGFAGAMFTGYHSCVGWDGNPLSHTMNTQNVSVRVNGEDAPELMINSLTASMLGVPVLMLSGDEMLCEFLHRKVPAAVTVPVSHGIGNGSISLMPGEAVRRIRRAAEEAMSLDPAACMYPMSERYEVEVMYRLHQSARRALWYPGAQQLDSRTVRYTCTNWMDVLTFFHFCL